jgi:hypothetical protein
MELEGVPMLVAVDEMSSGLAPKLLSIREPVMYMVQCPCLIGANGSTPLSIQPRSWR